MPSFDIKSEINSHELTNGVDQANRIIDNRFDFKGTGAKFTLGEKEIILSSQEEFQLQQMLPILKESLTKRGIDLKILKEEKVDISSGSARQHISLKEGIDKEMAKNIIQKIKSTKIKVQTAVQEESIRVTGKKRDDLQEVMKIIKGRNFDLPLHLSNFRD